MVFDDRRRPYFDFVLGMGPVAIGHANAEFNAGIHAALGSGLLMPGFTDVHAEYCSLLETVMPGSRVIAFLKTGSEAALAAARIAAIHTGKMGVIRCGYTGWHDAQLVRSPRWNEYLTSEARGALQHSDHLRGATADEPVANWIDLRLPSLKRTVECGSHGALIIDTYQASLTDLDAMVDAVRYCQQQGLVVVLDETKTAGRLGPAGAFEQTPLRGDLTILGKAIGNGFPLSVLVDRSGKFEREVRSTRIGGTFSKDALAVRATLITADWMRTHDGYRSLQRNGQRVSQVLNQAAQEADVAASLEVVPLLDGCLFEFRKSKQLAALSGARAQLEPCFAEEGILLFEGHCCFVCAEHEGCDWQALGAAAVSALKQWRSAIRTSGRT
jgi:glutamate-1-semialdehyde 2,1-aminomutase